jgi:hypothetical protein
VGGRIIQKKEGSIWSEMGRNLKEESGYMCSEITVEEDKGDESVLSVRRRIRGEEEWMWS